MKNIQIIAAALCTAVLASCGAESVREPTAETTAVQTTAAPVTTAVTETAPDDGTFTDSETVEMYDSTPISEAYLSGDTSKLDDIQQTIYDLAVKVIEDNVTEDMTDYEKELAIHDYLIANVTYDTDELSVFETHGVHSADPYGALTDGRCICLGYTTTFQMFMDMLEIPCISIRGESIHRNEDNADHAWNMVEINGHSYYVDVTWDDPVPDKDGRPIRHKYFNVGEGLMKEKHLWDESLTAQTDSAEDSYISHELRVITDESEIADIMEETLAANKENFYIEPADAKGWDLSKAEYVDDYISGDVIKPSLSMAVSEFQSQHHKVSVRFQRVEHDGRIVAAGYIFNNT